LSLGAGGNNRPVSTSAPPPQCISLEFHRDNDHLVERAIRWFVIAALLLMALAALANVFGQHHILLVARSDAATVRVSAPRALRSGLLYQGKFQVEAHDRLRRPTLVLAPGWWDAMSVNSIEPQPTRSSSRDGSIAMEFDPLAAGSTLTVYVYLQVNPTTAGRRDQSVALRDGSRVLASIDHTVNVFP
jgi:hypothetical protein